MKDFTGRVTAIVLGLSLSACASGGGGGAEPAGRAEPADEAPPLVQPGAPGEATARVEAGELEGMAGVEYAAADVRFMQGMIHHHAQALDMTALVAERTGSEAVRRAALRIDISQKDEIALMERWLGERGEAVPDWAAPMGHGMAHREHAPDRPMMPGMLTPAQMERLAEARGPEFDRLFLEYMIQHHQGAIVMVDELFASSGGGQESEIFQFASHVEADQMAEIRRMRGMLEGMR